MTRIDLQSLARQHRLVGLYSSRLLAPHHIHRTTLPPAYLWVGKSLSTHDSLHVGGVAVLRGDDNGRGLLHALGHSDLAQLAFEESLEVGRQGLEALSVGLQSLLQSVFVLVAELKSFLRQRLHLHAIKVAQVSNGI